MYSTIKKSSQVFEEDFFLMLFCSSMTFLVLLTTSTWTWVIRSYFTRFVSLSDYLDVRSDFARVDLDCLNLTLRMISRFVIYLISIGDDMINIYYVMYFYLRLSSGDSIVMLLNLTEDRIKNLRFDRNP